MADSQMITELFQAAATNDAAAIQRLIRDGADPNAVSEYGNTPLHNACISGSADAARMLLSLGADPNLRYTYKSPVDGRNDPGLVALMTTPNPVVAQLMIEQGADPDAADDSGNTALMRAAKRGHPDVVRILLASGARPEKRNMCGQSAIDFAQDSQKFFEENATGFVAGHAEKRIKQIQQVLRLLAEFETS